MTLSGLADGVFLGGYETTASILALGTLVLLQSPEGRAEMLAGGEPAARVVEELLRYLSVVQVAFPRFARHDLTIHGRRVAAGDVVMFSLSGANRDDRLGAGHGGVRPLPRAGAAPGVRPRVPSLRRGRAGPDGAARGLPRTAAPLPATCSSR